MIYICLAFAFLWFLALIEYALFLTFSPGFFLIFYKGRAESLFFAFLYSVKKIENRACECRNFQKTESSHFLKMLTV